MSLVVSASQPRHLVKSAELIPEEDVLLVEVENEAVLASIMQDGYASGPTWLSTATTTSACCRPDLQTCQYLQLSKQDSHQNMGAQIEQLRGLDSLRTPQDICRTDCVRAAVCFANSTMIMTCALLFHTIRDAAALQGSSEIGGRCRGQHCAVHCKRHIHVQACADDKLTAAVQSSAGALLHCMNHRSVGSCTPMHHHEQIQLSLCSMQHAA